MAQSSTIELLLQQQTQHGDGEVRCRGTDRQSALSLSLNYAPRYLQGLTSAALQELLHKVDVRKEEVSRCSGGGKQAGLGLGAALSLCTGRARRVNRLC